MTNENGALASDIRVGDIVSFGTWNGVPLECEWRVLDIENGKALLITKGIITWQRYHEEFENITWEDCTLRRLLNTECLASLPASIRERVIEVTNHNPDNPKSHTLGGNDTKDMMFLLSIDEARKYFTSNADRVAKYNGSRRSWWWLRSPGCFSYDAAAVSPFGKVYEVGNPAHRRRLGVRPALWLYL